MTENGDTAQPISLTSQAAAEREASPLRPDEQDQDSTAATADDIVDKLVPAIENEDLAVCTFHLSQLHLRQRGVSPQSPDQQDHIDGVATAEDIVDKLVTAVEEEDIAACAFCLRQLRLRDQEKLVNRLRKSQRSDLVIRKRISRHHDELTPAFSRLTTLRLVDG